MKLADFWHRIAAALLDCLLLITVFLLLEVLFSTSETQAIYQDIARVFREEALGFSNSIWILGKMAEGQLGALRFSQLIIYLGYLIVLPIVWTKQTMGRLLLHIRIVKINERPLTPGTMIIREIMGIFLISFFTFGITFLISLIMMVVAPGRRTIHDRMSNTLVVQQ